MSLPSRLTLYQLNDQFIKITGLTDGLDPTVFFTNATVTATLKDRSGNVVSGVDHIVMTYIPDDNTPEWVDGSYIGAIQETFDPPTGGGYTMIIDTDQSGVVGHFEIKTKVKIRRS